MKTIAVLGLGLIGGSLGLALHQAGVANHISGYDSNPDATYQAWELGAITEICNTAEKAVQQADMVILATPILAMPELLEHIAPELKRGVLVTDKASTKVQILNWAKTLSLANVMIVEGHPIDGCELSAIKP